MGMPEARPLDWGRSSKAAKCPKEALGKFCGRFCDKLPLPWGNSPADTKLSMDPIGLAETLGAGYMKEGTLFGRTEAAGMPGCKDPSMA